MNKKVVTLALAAMLPAFCVPAEAQQKANVRRIGYLSTEVGTERNKGAFRQGLRELGYVEGRDIIIESRHSEGRFEKLTEFAEELVHLKVDLILANTATAARAAKKATTTLPIVMANAGDPIGSGLVVSLARPGGNVTGLTNYSPELLGKRLELLRDVVPKVSRFAFLNDAGSSASRAMFKDGQAAADALRVKLQLVELRDPNPDLEAAFRVMANERVGGLITAPGPRISVHRKRILTLAEQARMPAIYPSVPWTDDGGLMYYGPNTTELYRRAAVYVDKILKGAKPAELPVEGPMKFELVINLNAAKQIGLTIPQSVLYRADRVIR